ncbi:phage antirepressor KilAC domain-containing protein [Aeromonas sanarellii]|uniref:phage antirepressor KilAC domain-containing protein n=1 Tax=Aeromonas sanarellii TaxID=633415 RepID=UPI0038D0D5E3
MINQLAQKREGFAGAANALPVIAGVEITTDEAGRFNLNALHQASGGEKKRGPSYWLALDSTAELIAEVAKTTNTEIPVFSKRGLNGGTFAHELLAISYAGWISPAFQLQVNQVFLDYRTGKLAPVVDPMAALNDPATMRGLLLSYSEKVINLEHRVEEMQTDVEALERIAKADGSMCITDAAKHLQVQPKYLFQLLSAKQWIYKRAGGKSWVAYQDKLQSGVLEHKVTIVTRPDGSEKVTEQVLVTAKGIAKLAKMIGVSGVAA